MDERLQSTNARVRNLDDLVAVFHEAEKPREHWLVGTEAEKFGVCSGGSPLMYEGERGVNILFDRLIEQAGWSPVRETEDGPVIALSRDGTSITLEPGAQFELSGAPFRTVHETKTELEAHLEELRPISERCDLTWLGVGFQPFATRDELGWVPKLRYPIMREHMPMRGSMALDMMLRTCTVQANYDYASEEDAMRKLKVALRLQPIVTAMFANSPWVEGQDSGYRSYRALAWLHMDTDRSGLLPFAWKDHATYRDYVEWALDAPMFLFKQGKEVFYNTGQTFRAFMAEGHAGRFPTQSNWLSHIAALFPEARLKNTIEVRGADAQGRETVLGVPALWKGILYDEETFKRVEGWVDPFTFDSVEQERPKLAEHGVRTKFLNREAVDWAGELLDFAEAGLRRIGDINENGDDETMYLRPLRALLEQAKCPADALLEALDPKAPFVEQVLKLCAL